jgi:CRISPR/Cas system-associated protein Cas10 (large subunit of type III CRISPR-Cas system)
MTPRQDSKPKRVRHPLAKRKCLVCGKPFHIHFCQLKYSRGDYCSRSCAGRGRRKPENEPCPHTPTMVKLKTGRRCNICHRIIKVVPSDVDPRYARFCYTCRVGRQMNSDPHAWLGRGEEHGAGTGAYLFGSGVR